MKYDRRYKIDILQQSITQDEYGAPAGTWEPIFTGLWASKAPILGNEYFTAQATQTKVEVKFECEYTNGITNAMRLQCDDEIYEILSAIDVKGLNRDLLLYCKKVI